MRPLSDRDRDALALTRRRLRRVLEGLPSSTGLALEMNCVVPHWIRRLDAMIGPEVAVSEDFDATSWPEDCGASDPDETLRHMADHWDC